MIEQNGVASSEKVQHSIKQRESLKLKDSAKNAKQKPRNHHQILYSPSSLALFRAKNWLKQPSTNIQSQMNTYYSGFKMVFLNTERRTIIHASAIHKDCTVRFLITTLVFDDLSTVTGRDRSVGSVSVSYASGSVSGTVRKH